MPEPRRAVLRPGVVLAALLAVAMAMVSVGLGLWQLRRMHEKRALNVAQRAAIIARPWSIGDTLPSLEALRGRRVVMRGRRVVMRGRYDESRQVLLVGREHDGVPGVHVVTPLLVRGSTTAVLVDRGWMAADDPMAARPQAFTESGEREVLGLAEALPVDTKAPALLAAESDSVTLWLAERLDAKVLEGRFPYTLEPFVLLRLPRGADSAGPVAEEPPAWDETKHLSYAIQWFAIAVLALVGPVLITRQGRGRQVRPPRESDPAA